MPQTRANGKPCLHVSRLFPLYFHCHISVTDAPYLFIRWSIRCPAAARSLIPPKKRPMQQCREQRTLQRIWKTTNSGPRAAPFHVRLARTVRGAITSHACSEHHPSFGYKTIYDRIPGAYTLPASGVGSLPALGGSSGRQTSARTRHRPSCPIKSPTMRAVMTVH